MNLPQHLIITVGTSLLGNLNKAGLANAVFEKQKAPVLAYLERLNPTQYEAGAELNSTYQLLQQEKVHSQAHLHFCISDTPDGRFVGEVLKSTLKTLGKTVSLHTIEGLQAQDPVRFSREGLRNLVRLCGKIVLEAGGPQAVALNATGGYKAQIAIAALIGSALGIPVYYKHEMFDNVIGFPPMPVSLDDQLIERHLGYLLAVEAQVLLNNPPEEEALIALLDIVQEGKDKLYALSPLGQICLASYEQRHPIKKTLPPAATERKLPRMRDDHYPKGFETFVEKVWQETPYISQVISLPYDRNRAIRDRYFYTRPDEPDKLIGEYVDKDGFGARFRILISSGEQRQIQAVLRDLTLRYSL